MGWLDYINASPDLAAAYKTSGSTDPNAWASQHYNAYGANEDRAGVPDSISTPTEVKSLYNTYLGRDPGTGAAGWTGQSDTDVLSGILNSDEYKNRVPGLVNSSYTDVLGRPQGEGEGAAWQNALLSGQITPDQLTSGFTNSPEALARSSNPTPTGLLPDPGATPRSTTPGGGIFDLPTLTKDIYPTSESGYDWSSGYGPDLLKQLTASVNALPGLAQNFGDTLQSQYTNLMRKSLSPDMFQGTLNNLASRGMLGSSEAGNAMSTTAKDIMSTVGDRAYESQLQGLQQQMQLPGLLGQLGQLLQRSKSSNPLAPYELAMNYY